VATKYNNNKVFDTMLESAAPDKTLVNLFGPKPTGPTSETLHNTLMAAGMVPGAGIAADLLDAAAYVIEGELGSAALSGAAAIPVFGQMVSAKRMLKAAKKSGEEMVTLYRGVDKWHPGKMVKEGKFVGGGKWYKKSKKYIPGGTRKKEGIFTTTKKDLAEIDFNKPGSISNEVILEFEVPKSYKSKHSKEGWLPWDLVFEEGIPKEFLKKVHKK
jgi:hypothetical protein